MNPTKIWMDGDLLPWGEATASPVAHGLHYGTGVFEGIRSYNTAAGPKVFRLREHLERMQQGALRMEKIPSPRCSLGGAARFR